MKYECLTKDGKLVIAKQEGWKWSERELKEFDLATYEQSIIATANEEVVLSNGVKTTLLDIDPGLVAFTAELE